MFHNTRNKNVITITDCIYFKFCTHHILINKHRVLYILCKDDSHIFLNICLVKGNNHILTT